MGGQKRFGERSIAEVLAKIGADKSISSTISLGNLGKTRRRVRIHLRYQANQCRGPISSPSQKGLRVDGNAYRLVFGTSTRGGLSPPRVNSSNDSGPDQPYLHSQSRHIMAHVPTSPQLPNSYNEDRRAFRRSQSCRRIRRIR
jgi:hypothetical protein